jgi:hypothetical protein
VALDGTDGAIGVGDGLALGHLADEDLTRLRERDDRRGGARSFGVGDDDGVARLEDADDRVGGAEVDTDGLGHGCLREENVGLNGVSIKVECLVINLGLKVSQQEAAVASGPGPVERPVWGDERWMNS